MDVKNNESLISQPSILPDTYCTSSIFNGISGVLREVSKDLMGNCGLSGFMGFQERFTGNLRGYLGVQGTFRGLLESHKGCL